MTKNTITILNTKAGNLTSLKAAFHRLNYPVEIINHAKDFNTQSQVIVIPGQGRFGPVMDTLNKQGFTELIKEWHHFGRPMLGICVGLQVLYSSSDENPQVSGLNIFKGHVSRLNSPKQPMVGWCRVESEKNYVPSGDAYFVNSYIVKNAAEQMASTEYGEPFSCIVHDKGTIAFQFHPEKSGDYGLKVLQSCLNYLNA